MSLLGLRERAIRLWLAGVSLLAFGAAYLSPMVLAVTQPTVTPTVVLPSLTLPLVAFPSLDVPKLVAPRALPAAATHTTTTPATTRRVVHKRLVGRVIPQMGPPYNPAGRTTRTATTTRTRTVPVVKDSYTLTPPAAKKTKEKADPFAKAPVIEDTVGIPQSIGDTTVDTATADVEDTTGVVPPSFGGAADDTATGGVVEDTTDAVPTMDDSPAVTPAATTDNAAAPSADPTATSPEGTGAGTYGYRATASASPAASTQPAASFAPAAAEMRAPSTAAETPTPPPATTEPTTPPAATDTAAVTATATTTQTTATTTTTEPAPTVTTITAPPVLTTATSSTPAVVSTTTAPTAATTSAASSTASSPTAWAVQPVGAGADHAISVATTGTDVVVTVDGTATSRPAGSVASLTITGGDGADTLTIDATAAGIPVAFDGGAGNDTVRGPPADSTWTISGAGAGTVGAVTFTGVENVVGAPDNEDTFVFESGGTLAGTVDGGAGGFDTLVVDGNRSSLVSSPTAPDAGTLTVDATTIRYAGLEPIAVTGTVTDAIVNLTAGNDAAILETDPGDSTKLKISGGTFESTSFTKPTGSVTVNGIGGTDSITIRGAIALGGAALIVNAETINVEATASITTTGAVTLAAHAQNTDTSQASTLAASVTVAGGLNAGATQVTAVVEQTLALVVPGATAPTAPRITT